MDGTAGLIAARACRVAARCSAHRRDGDRRALARMPGDLRAGREGFEVFRQTEAHVDKLPVAAGDRYIVSAQIGVGGDKGLLDVPWRKALPLVWRLEHCGRIELVAHETDRGEIVRCAK